MAAYSQIPSSSTVISTISSKANKKKSIINKEKSMERYHSDIKREEDEEKNNKNTIRTKLVISTQKTLQEIQFDNMIGVGKQRTEFNILKLTEEEQHLAHNDGLSKALELLPVLQKLVTNKKINKIRTKSGLLDSYVSNITRIYVENATEEHYTNIGNMLIQIWSIINAVNIPILRLLYWITRCSSDINKFDSKVLDCIKDIALIHHNNNLGKYKQTEIFNIMGSGLAKSLLKMYTNKISFEEATVTGTYLLHIIDSQKKEGFEGDIMLKYIKAQGVRTEQARKSAMICDYRLVCHTDGCYNVETYKLFNACGKCKKTIYCSEECQKTSWPNHKTTCK